jgi:hypothetical protein
MSRKKMRKKLAKKVLAGQMTVGEARAALGRAIAQKCAGIDRTSEGGLAKLQALYAEKNRWTAPLPQATPPAVYKNWRPMAVQLWTAAELAAMAPFADSCDPAMRAIADAKLAERTVM